MPLDLSVNQGICQTHLGQLELAETNFKKLMDQDVESYGDLYYDVAETYFSTKQPEKAATVYRTLVTASAYNHPAMYMRMAECYLAYNNFADAIQTFHTGKSSLVAWLSYC